jgi:hypothetical protein
MNQIVVGKLIVFLATIPLRSRIALLAFRVGRRDEPKIEIEDVNQVIEVSGAVRIPGCFKQLLA